MLYSTQSHRCHSCQQTSWHTGEGEMLRGALPASNPSEVPHLENATDGHSIITQSGQHVKQVVVLGSVRQTLQLRGTHLYTGSPAQQQSLPDSRALSASVPVWESPCACQRSKWLPPLTQLIRRALNKSTESSRSHIQHMYK